MEIKPDKLLELAVMATGPSKNHANYVGTVVDTAANLSEVGNYIELLGDSQYIIAELQEVLFNSTRSRGVLWFIDPRDPNGTNNDQDRAKMARDDENDNYKFVGDKVWERIHTNVTYGEIGQFVYEKAQKLVGEKVGIVKVVQEFKDKKTGKTKKDRWAIAIVGDNKSSDDDSDESTPAPAKQAAPASSPTAPPVEEAAPAPTAPPAEQASAAPAADSDAAKDPAELVENAPRTPIEFATWAKAELNADMDEIRAAWKSTFASDPSSVEAREVLEITKVIEKLLSND